MARTSASLTVICANYSSTGRAAAVADCATLTGVLLSGWEVGGRGGGGEWRLCFFVRGGGKRGSRRDTSEQRPWTPTDHLSPGGVATHHQPLLASCPTARLMLVRVKRSRNKRTGENIRAEPLMVYIYKDGTRFRFQKTKQTCQNPAVYHLANRDRQIWLQKG